MKKVVKIIAGSLLVLPLLASAQNATYVSNLITQAKNLLDQLVVFLMAFAVVWFIWNVIRFTMASDEDKKADARKQMIWGIVALAVIFSIWGLVSLLQTIFGVQSTNAVNPTILLPR